MDRRALIALAPLALIAAPARASAPKKPAAAATDGQYVDLAPVALPIVVRGLLVNYVFASVRIQLSAMANTSKLRTKEPYFRDALVRAAHRSPFFTLATDYTKIDEAKLKAVLLREAIAIGGAKEVKGVAVLSQSPKKRTGLPTLR
ncbi:MAG: hypothetical protein Q7U11_25570 [Phenylobacterium sp.]|uniref:hypothetical protein n=1 Tax=Phenylobacterium sp. TaxID=1871053 RepID=UPI00271E030F|nr:hypothetical protein [Phenylobacterium sp.]MDO9249841.1 hypothetical protein [Phenylobacterium sp.]MDP2008709.1 hypothetical protein [Phenylobacterium sp.]MDP3867102.1 hypothetical protein [Phenylobacterium sp.]HQT54125.1 hypothetical protein [Phenylobacterium sp.]